MKTALAAVLLALAAALHATAQQAALQTFGNCRYIETPSADGDSFLVEFEPGRQELLRLYFVDCPETAASSDTDKRRVREQSAYFGVAEAHATMEAGREATAEVARLLSKPFTVHTAMSSALGRSARTRYYAFITLSDGRDLGEYLVERGLARSHGVGRTTPTGISMADAKAHLDDLEMKAAMERAGLWSRSDPAKLVAMREARREEARELESMFGGGSAEPIDPNTATIDEMVLLPGVGPVLAERIIDGRPYTDVDDLRRVPGIGNRTFERLKDQLVVGR